MKFFPQSCLLLLFSPPFATFFVQGVARHHVNGSKLEPLALEGYSAKLKQTFRVEPRANEALKARYEKLMEKLKFEKEQPAMSQGKNINRDKKHKKAPNATKLAKKSDGKAKVSKKRGMDEKLKEAELGDKVLPAAAAGSQSLPPRTASGILASLGKVAKIAADAVIGVVAENMVEDYWDTVKARHLPSPSGSRPKPRARPVFSALRLPPRG